MKAPKLFEIKRKNAVLRRAIKREAAIAKAAKLTALLSTRLEDLKDFNAGKLDCSLESLISE